MHRDVPATPAFAVIATVALLGFALPLLRGEVFTFRDHGDYFQPLRWFTAEELRHGRLPLWNAYNASGEPWLANPQTGIFYPPAWMFVFLPFATAYTLFLCLHVMLLGAGGFLLFSRFASSGAALAAALALMFCGPSISLLDISNNLTTFAWIPLVTWCALAGVGPEKSALAIAMSFLAGEPFFAAVGAAIFAVIRRRDVLRVGAAAVALSAIQLFPFLAMVRGSDRTGGVPRDQMLRDSVPLRDWIRLAIPPNVGLDPLDRHLTQHFIPIVYVGALTVFLAVVALIFCPSRRAVKVWGAFILFCGLIAAGAYLAPVAALLAHMPLTLFRYPARLVPLATLGIFALAAIGCDRVVKPRWQLPIAMAMLLDVFLQSMPLLASAPFEAHRVPYPRSIGRDAKIVRIGIERARRIERRAWIAGYMNLFDRRFDAWTAAPLSSQQYTQMYETALVQSRVDVLNAMSIGYILSTDSMGALPVIAQAGSVKVFRNPAAFPMAYFRADAPGRITSAAWLAVTTASAHMAIDAPSAGVVVLSQQFAPGWRVEVDGNAAMSMRDGVFRAVHVGPGHHQIIWKYRPSSLLIGALVTIVALARMLFSIWFVKRAKHQNLFRDAVEMRGNFNRGEV